LEKRRIGKSQRKGLVRNRERPAKDAERICKESLKKGGGITFQKSKLVSKMAAAEDRAANRKVL